MVEIVQLYDGRPSLRDIPGRLRNMADRIEAGEDGDLKFAVVVIVRVNHSQAEFGFGDVNMHEAVGAFAWAASHIGATPLDSI